MDAPIDVDFHDGNKVICTKQAHLIPGVKDKVILPDGKTWVVERFRYDFTGDAVRVRLYVEPFDRD